MMRAFIFVVIDLVAAAEFGQKQGAAIQLADSHEITHFRMRTNQTAAADSGHSFREAHQ